MATDQAEKQRRRFVSRAAGLSSPWEAGFVFAIGIVTALALAFVLLVPVVGNEGRVQDVDPMFLRNIIERAAVYGGSYYQNGIYNKGVLEPITYDLAHHIVSYDGFWFAISAFVAILSVGIAFAAARTAVFTGANRLVALAVAAFVYIHFTVAETGYTRVLYSRNLTVTALAVAWLLALSDWAWVTPRRAAGAAAVFGFVLGAAIQELTTTAFAASVVAGVAIAMARERRPSGGWRRLVVIGSATSVAAFVAPPIWYLLRGSFTEFWASWWTQARYMSVGTGRSLPSQFRLGLDRFYTYYQHRPEVCLLVIAFLGATGLMWSRLDRRGRIVHVGLIGWFGAAWIELVLSQRYSSHYFAVLAVPTALMAAALCGHAARMIGAVRRLDRAWLLLPLATTALGIYLSGPSIFVDEVEQTIHFRGIAATAAGVAKYEPGSARSAHAVLDLVSAPNAPLLAWTNDPTVYLKYHRVPATRFEWKSFLLGEIYLGRTSPKYVLPHTWKWFAEDVAETRPIAFVETEPFKFGTPFDALIATHFRRVLQGGGDRVWLRDDVASSVLAAPAGANWTSPSAPSGGSGWRIAGTTARYHQAALAPQDDRLVLASHSCLRLQGTLVGFGQTAPSITFQFDDNVRATERLLMLLTPSEAGSGSIGLGAAGFERIATGLGSVDRVPFALIVGRRAAVLVVNREVRAALRLPHGSFTVSVTPQGAPVELRDLRVASPPERSC